ncbi:MAG: sulfotransferase [Proteobacteria bacterium]|nr:sulfotransferase [Pseudomonadota bacterium]
MSALTTSGPISAADIEAHRLFNEAHALEAAGDFDAAFRTFERANRLKRSTLRPQDLARMADEKAARNLELYGEAYIRASEGKGHPSTAPVFVIGMPRSGSTLIEQILIAHPEVWGLGECNALMPLVAKGPPAEARLAGAAYLDSLRQLGWRNTRRVVDKSLMNFAAVGLLHAMFPRATIIHSVREPLDTCLSIWRRHFASGNDTSYDLEDIADDYVRYRKVMAAWEKLLPGRVCEVVHEDLVADPEGQMKRLVAATGMSWNRSCLRFYEARRTVRDGAAEQARTPVNRHGVARWKRYEEHLAPLIDRLGPFARLS